MNILHLQLFGYIGGMQTICREINFQSENNNFFYFLFEGGPISDQIKETGSGVVVEHAPHHFFLKSLYHFIKYCKEKKIDVVICHAGSPIAWIHLIVCSIFLKNIKYGVYEHGDIVDMIGNGGIKTWIGKRIMIEAIKRADFVAAVSEFVKKRNKEILGISTDKVHVVYNGIRSEDFAVNNRIDHDTFHIVYVGRIFSKKGVHLLVEMAKYFPNDMKYTIDIIGEGPDVPELQKRVQEMGLQYKIFFRGPQLDISEWLKKMDLFVHPAVWEEGFGITLVEAMASSIPCVAFHKGALPELIQHGVNGYIVEDTSAEALAKTVYKCYRLFLTDQYNSLRESAKETGSKFHIKNTVKLLEDLYLL